MYDNNQQQPIQPTTNKSQNKKSLTLEQQIAQKQDELARLKEKANQLSNAQKIVLGGMVLSVARKDKNFANQLLAMMKTEINRDTDKKRLTSVFDELKEITSNQGFNHGYSSRAVKTFSLSNRYGY